MGLQAFQCSIVIMFYVCLTASINLLNAKAEIHIVGDSYGWVDFIDFNNWADGREFHVGDLLVFDYESSQHNVLQVDSTAYEDCMKASYIHIFNSGNDSLALGEVGRVWFICGVNDHCENGQKLSVDVTP